MEGWREEGGFFRTGIKWRWIMTHRERERKLHELWESVRERGSGDVKLRGGRVRSMCLGVKGRVGEDIRLNIS